MPENPQYPQVSQDDALKHIDNNGVAIYWRPGAHSVSALNTDWVRTARRPRGSISGKIRRPRST
ncbi:hypothetical protein ACFOLD_16850 [Kocuria carniphila]|uniref:hypothetical protein n=1 Tax=Kocuria carniphila TaxID=262208 RepID=UPI003617B416